jgi:uncharacterized protein YbjT (DUF2867 family)
MSKIAVAGATGQVGTRVVAALEEIGHSAIQLSRSQGVDIFTGEGLDDALDGAVAVIDVLSTNTFEAAAATEFFTTTSNNLLAAEERAKVGHHVLLSIVNVDIVRENGHFTGKLAQEQCVRESNVPWSILRATQFHTFAEMIATWDQEGRAAAVAPLKVQPVDVGDVAHALAKRAVQEPQRDISQIAGPDTMTLVEMTVETFGMRGRSFAVRPMWTPPFHTPMADDVLLPRRGTTFDTGPTSFASWLETEERKQAVSAGKN